MTRPMVRVLTRPALALAESGVLTAGILASATGCSERTALRVIAELVAAGQVTEAGERKRGQPGRGRAARRFELAR